MRKFRGKGRWYLPLALALSTVVANLPLAGAESRPDLPSGVERPRETSVLIGLVNQPRTAAARVETFQREGQSWCACDADCIGVFRLPLETLSRVLRDHENYPRVFPRISSNVVRREGPRITESQTVSVNILGINYRNVYTLLGSEQLLDNPRRLFIQWKQTDSGGSIQGIEGLWYLEEFVLDGQVHTFVRYRMKSEMPNLFVPGQAALVKLFLEADLAESMRNVARAAGMADARPPAASVRRP